MKRSMIATLAIMLAQLGTCFVASATTPLPSDSAVVPSPVIWDSPSKNALGSMPIGNGDIAANVWVEPGGELIVLLAKTDAYDEFNRLLKLGRVRIKTTPSLAAEPFRQTLRMDRGAIEITAGPTQARVWIDANHPLVEVDLQSPKPIQAEVKAEIWRTAPRALDRRAGREREETSCAYNRPEKNRVNPDTILPHRAAQLAWCHHNVESQWAANLELTGLGAEIAKGTDPILNRTFGAVVRGTGFEAVSDTEMKTAAPAARLSIQIFPLTKIAASATEWLKAAEAQADGIAGDPQTRLAAHEAWWRQFWGRSWIEVSAADPAEAAAATRVAAAYAQQRYMTACAGRGALPIKFNGSLFTVDQVFDPDYRRWGGAYWWQNTRLPYWGLLYAGDYDELLPLVKMYRDALPLRQAATKKYYGHDGAFFPETMYFWGNYTDGNYGLNRKGKPDGLTDNGYIRRYWQGGLELLGMMLDCYDDTQDAAFRDQDLLPLAKEIVRFFDEHWKRGPDGKVLYAPAQSLETWHTAVDPLPEIAGLRYLLPRLLTLPVDEATKSQWRKLLADQPEVPAVAKDGQTRLLPAKTFGACRNCENPELYAVFPYRVYTALAGEDRLKIGVATWKSRKNRANAGWQQQPIQAALLGLADEAKALVVQRTKGTAGGYRFPGFYGPNYDWTPDQDHPSVFAVALQRMLMQCEGERIVLLPAWPKGWNARFKLHAPKNTTVEGRVEGGQVKDLRVLPESRRKDVELPR